MGFGYAAVFRVVLPISVVDMLNNVIHIEDELPPFLRHSVKDIVSQQDFKPLPCYIGAVSTLNECHLELHVFIGSDFDLFESAEGCQCAADSLQQALRAFVLKHAPPDQGYLASAVFVSWEPNLLTA